MSLAVASGQPQYAGNFIPEVWSGKLVVKFYDATVFGEIANTDYEGEIKAHGDKVNIRQTPDIEIRDYTKGQALVTQNPDATKLELLIDKGKYFNFGVDSVDKYQSDINLIDDWATDASEQMKIKIDTGVLGDIYADVHASNKGATAGRISASFNLGATGAPVQLTKTNILDKIIDLGTILDEYNIPESGRWLVLPAWACGMLKKSDFKDASMTGDSVSIARNGRVGLVDRFMIYMSNNIATVTDTGQTVFNILAGHKAALTFASQMTEMDTLKTESSFGWKVRGLNVYGYEVVKPDAMALLYAYR